VWFGGIVFESSKPFRVVRLAVKWTRRLGPGAVVLPLCTLLLIAAGLGMGPRLGSGGVAVGFAGSTALPDPVSFSSVGPGAASQTTYSVQFSEEGLPDGESWSVAANGTSFPQFPTISVPGEPWGIAIDPDKDRLYVTEFEGNNLTVINTTTRQVVNSIPTGVDPRRVVIDPANGQLYVSCTEANNVAVINATTGHVIGAIPVGPDPIGLTFDASDNRLFVADSNVYGEGNLPSNVSVIDTVNDSVVARIPVGSDARELVYDPLNHDLYVENYNSGNVTVIGARNLTTFGSIDVGSFPLGTAIDDATGQVFFMDNYDPGMAYVIDGSSQAVVGTIGLGSYPGAGAYDSANGYVYISESFSDEEAVINGSSLQVVGLVPAGIDPSGMVFDSVSHFLYVASPYTDRVLAINGSTRSLPAGEPIPTVIETDVVAGGFGGIQFNLVNGTYTFNFNRTAGYDAEPPTLLLAVDGSGYLGTVDFYGMTPLSSAPALTLTLAETYLLAGAAVGALIVSNIAWFLHGRSRRPPTGPTPRIDLSPPSPP